MNAERFGPYELGRMIGRGGMGEVFEAYDTEQDRTVALKRLAPHMVHDQEFQHRFRRESRLAARLRSPHVVPIHRSGEIDGQLFIDMRLVEGCDLEQLLVAETRLSAPRAVAIIEQVGWALDSAHQAGLIHRDIKPSNVLLDHTSEGHEFVYLADFGITRAVGSDSVSLTSTHAVLGSLDYMAPEQFDGIVSAEVDIYSLGCLLFQCLTGSKPFPAEGFPALMRAHLTRPAPLVSQLLPELGDRFDEVIARGLAKDPAERYPSAGDLAAAARTALAGIGARRRTSAGPTGPDSDQAGQPASSATSDPGRDTEFWEEPAPAVPKQRGGTEVRPGPVRADHAAAAERTPEGSAAHRSAGGVLTAAKAETVSKPRRDHSVERVVPPRETSPRPSGTSAGDGPLPPAAPPVVTPPAESPPSGSEPLATDVGSDPAPGRGGRPEADSREAPPPEPPPPPPPPSADDAAGAVPPAPWWTRPGLLIAGGVVVLVALLGLGALVGMTVLGSQSSTGNASGALGQGAVALPPPAPMLRSSDVPTVASTFSVGNGPEAIALSPDGARAYVTGESGANVLNVTDTARGTVLATIPAPGPPQFIVMDSSGTHGYVTLWDQTKDQNAVAVFDVRRNAFTAIIPTGEQRPFGLGILLTAPSCTCPTTTPARSPSSTPRPSVSRPRSKFLRTPTGSLSTLPAGSPMPPTTWQES